MAKQVKPGLIQPAKVMGLSRVRINVQASTSGFHQGPRPKRRTNEAECTTAISTCESKPRKTKPSKTSLAVRGASMYDLHVWFRSFRAKLSQMKNIPGCGRGGVGFDENAAKPVIVRPADARQR